MTSPYKRRRPMLIRTAWEHRKLIALAIVLGVMLWFIASNWEKVTITLPFWLGTFETRSAVAILLGALAGSIVTALTIAVVWTTRRRKSAPEEEEKPTTALSDELPPPDYASKAKEGFPGAPWTTV